MIDNLEKWLQDNYIAYELRRNDVVIIPGFGRCLYQDMNDREHIFKTDKEGNVVFNSVEPFEYLREDDIKYILFQFGKCFYYLDIDDSKQEFKILKYVGEFTGTDIKVDNYYPLGIHSGFELLNGSGSLALWAKKAKFYGYRGISCCDKNTMAGSLDLQRETTAQGLKYCFGYSLTFEVGDNKVGAKIYAQTQNGFQNLLRIQKVINVDRIEDKVIDIVHLCEYAEGNVIVFDKLSGSWLADEGNDDVINDILDSFSAAYFQVDLSEYKADRIDSQVLQSTKAYFDAFYFDWDDYEYGIEPVLIQDVYYADADDYKNKDVLNRIAIGAVHEKSDRQYMKTLDELYDEFDNLFSDKYDERVFYRMCENTARIIEPADACYDMTDNYMPQYEMTPEEKAKYGTNLNMFHQLIEEGFKRLVPEGEEERYRQQVEYEKYVIESTDNVNYFLVQYDCVNWARANDILVGIGRGSAGGCVLLYLMGITKIDPIAYNLIFERFLLPERAGLEPAEVTKLVEDIPSDDYFELTLEDGNTYCFDKDAQFKIKRNGQDMVCYCDELMPDDDIVFDNIHLVNGL